MYTVVEAEKKQDRRVRRLVVGMGSLWGTAIAIVAAAGIPLAWIWIASKLAGTKRDLTPSLAVLIATGMDSTSSHASYTSPAPPWPRSR